MRASTRRRMSMAIRALHFCQAQPSDDTGYTALVKSLGDAVAQSDPLVAQQQQGIAEQHSVRLRREGLRVGITQRLRHLSRVGALLQQGGTTPPAQFRSAPAGMAFREFIPLAKSMLDLATANKDALLPLGLGATFIDDLTASVTALDAATEEANLARARHVGASAELGAATGKAVELVRVIDGFNRNRFEGDAEQLAAWESATSVGTPRHPVTPASVPVPGPEPIPGPVPQPVTGASDAPESATDLPQEKAA